MIPGFGKTGFGRYNLPRHLNSSYMFIPLWPNKHLSYGKSPAASGSWAIDKLLGCAVGYTWIICTYIYIYYIKLRSYIYQQPQPHPQVVTTLDSQPCVSSPNLRNPPKSGPRRHPKSNKNQTSRGKTWNSDPGLP